MTASRTKIKVALTVFGGVLCLGLGATPVVQAATPIGTFTVSVSSKKYSRFGASGNLVKTITLRGPGVKQSRPAIKCNRRFCGRVSKFSRPVKRVRRGQTLKFKGVNWLVAKGRGFQINMVAIRRSKIGMFVELAPPDQLNKRFTIKSAGCISRKSRKVSCPPGTPLPAITFKQPKCATPAFTRPPLRTSSPLTAGEQALNGQFINYGGDIYRMAGGAPIYVSSWAPWGGPQPNTAVSSATFDSYRKYPADGTFLVGSATLRTYIVAGGAPQYIGSWSIYGGVQPNVFVDEFTLDRAGGTSKPLDRLRKYPADGTFIRAHASGQHFVFAGGAPLALSSWAPFGGAQPTVLVDETNNWNPAAPWGNNTRQQPADGTLISAAGSDVVYRVMGGKPTRVCTAFDASQVVTVAPEAVANAGSTGIWSHLLGPVVE